MYSEEVTRIPRDEVDMWALFRDQFDLARMVLESPVESREEALEKVSTLWEGEAGRSGETFAIRYRDVGSDLDQRDYYLQMGLELLPYVEGAVRARKLTPEFVQQWGKVMFCHGFIASFVFDDSDGLGHKRAGLKTARVRSKDGQRNWIAHIMVRCVDAGMTRAEAEAVVVAQVEEIIASGRYPDGFGKEWFAPIITHGDLASTYDQKHFSVKAMRQLVLGPADNIPPVPAKIP
ncbi:MAG: hypothetical protein J0H01_14160 [Rhizobiales bacterium]|nr:hypothetical protein [Hyphomicrobiales bacterium]